MRGETLPELVERFFCRGECCGLTECVLRFLGCCVVFLAEEEEEEEEARTTSVECLRAFNSDGDWTVKLSKLVLSGGGCCEELPCWW